jgi:hypothetical protein
MLKLQDKDSKTSESDPPKAVKSGFEKCRRQIELGLFSMSIVYGLVLSINPPVSPGVDSCPEDKFPCQRSDLLAYKITSAFSLMYMGFLGFKNWYFSQQVEGCVCVCVFLKKEGRLSELVLTVCISSVSRVLW